MPYNLKELTKQNGATRKSKRRGGGFGSGKGGHTTGTGTKGQKAREGATPHLWFEGGQTPIVRKLPFIYGFKRAKKYTIATVNLTILDKFESDQVITPELLKQNGYGDDCDYFKVLGSGKIKNKVNIEGLWFTQTAKEKIEKAGGSVK